MSSPLEPDSTRHMEKVIAASVATSVPDLQLANERKVLETLFFFSGFPALMYQLVWQRALFRIFGVNIEAVTIVVTAFMLGLGLGSLAGGWLSRRRRMPLLPLLASIELATGVFGLASLSLFDQVGHLTAGLSLAGTAAVTLGLVLVPTLLMGATLPVLVGYLAQRSGNVGSSVGTLYYVNTLGAGAACLIAIIAFFPFFGMHDTVLAAVAMNGAVAAGALITHVRSGAACFAVPTGEKTEPRPALIAFPSALGLAFLGGFISLSYEIFLFRTASFASGSSASAFAATLGAFLIGIASGARRASETSDTESHGAMRHLLHMLVLANVIGFAFLPLITHLAWLDRALLGVILLLAYLLARGWGGLLPALAHFGVAADASAGMNTAWLYLANIVGSTSGSVLTGFVLMDRFGLATIATMLSALGLVCLLLMVLLLPFAALQRWLGVGAALAAAAMAAQHLPGWSKGALEALQWKGAMEHAGRFTDVVENRSGIITVDRNGVVYGHGMYDGKFNTDIVHDSNGIIRPYALSLFHPRPREVLMIGLSTGSWAQVIANNPEVEKLTVVEINPGYSTLIEKVPEVASLLNNPKIRLIVADGRHWLQTHPQKFDVVVSNTTWHHRANATNLLSEEFLQLVRAHLNPGGVFFYNTTDSIRVQRTGCQVFPYGVRFTNHMVVSDAPLDWSTERWRGVIERYRIDDHPVLPPGAENAALLERVAGGLALPSTATGGSTDSLVELCANVIARSSDFASITDDNMGTEWRHVLGLE